MNVTLRQQTCIWKQNLVKLNFKIDGISINNNGVNEKNVKSKISIVITNLSLISNKN
jgi:hypothetical protein